MSLMMLILMPFCNKSAIDIDYPFFEKTLQIKLNISITYIYSILIKVHPAISNASTILEKFK